MAAADQEEGFKAILAENGETVTFRETIIAALVNRNVVDDRAGKLPKFSPHDASEIQLLASDIPLDSNSESKTPEAGEEFTDSFGHHHRIKTVKRIGYAVTCRCEVSDPV